MTCFFFLAAFPHAVSVSRGAGHHGYRKLVKAGGCHHMGAQKEGERGESHRVSYDGC